MRAIGLCCRTTDSLGYEYKKGLQLIADPFLDTSLRWYDGRFRWYDGQFRWSDGLYVTPVLERHPSEGWGPSFQPIDKITLPFARRSEIDANASL
jgi:hypothetical protein